MRTMLFLRAAAAAALVLVAPTCRAGNLHIGTARTEDEDMMGNQPHYTEENHYPEAGECRADDTSCTAAADDEEEEEVVIASMPDATIRYDNSNAATAEPSLRLKQSDDGCIDTNDNCPHLRRYCIDRFALLHDKCPQTCQICGNRNATHVWNLYSAVPQSIAKVETDHQEAFETYLQEVNDYMYQDVYNQSLNAIYEPVRTPCQNLRDDCYWRAYWGQCETEQDFMFYQCAPACLACEYFTYREGCGFDWTEPQAWPQPGHVHALFERIATADPSPAAATPTTDESSPTATTTTGTNYTVTILSRPDPDAVDTMVGHQMTGTPWVVQLDNFLTPEECDTLQRLAAEQGYEESKVGESFMSEEDGGGVYVPGGYKSVSRTSSQAWCRDDCEQHNTTRAVLSRIHELVQIPLRNFELLQILRYEKGQYYERHHDYFESHKAKHHGPRILTVFLYLNTVPQGGGTRFPLLNNLTVTPQQGRALIWPSVLDAFPMESDVRLDHEALPVGEGVKHAANVWIHQRDFQTPLDEGCL